MRKANRNRDTTHTSRTSWTFSSINCRASLVAKELPEFLSRAASDVGLTKLRELYEAVQADTGLNESSVSYTDQTSQRLYRLAAHNLGVVYTFRGIARVHDETRFLNDSLIVVVRVVCHDQNAIVLA